MIGRKDQKTDDELKAVMPTHPWAPAIVHGFYKLFGKVWKEEKEIGHMADAIWIDGGLTYFDTNNKWVVENFYVPNIYRAQEPALLFTPHERRRHDVEKEWWSRPPDQTNTPGPAGPDQPDMQAATSTQVSPVAK